LIDSTQRLGQVAVVTDLLIVLTLLGAAIVMFAVNKPRLDAVALIMLVALPFTGILTMGEVLAGFSDPNIVLIAALFVLGEGLVRTGVAQRLDPFVSASRFNKYHFAAPISPTTRRKSPWPRSSWRRLLVGQTIADAGFRTRLNLTVIGLQRGVVAHGREFLHEPLAIGDTLLLIGPWRELEKLRSDGSRLVILHMAAERDAVLPAPKKAVYALACLSLVVGLMVSGAIPNVQAVLIGCLLMGALGCIDFNSAYRSIDWKTIVLIVGMLPFSIALERTGGVHLAADGLRALTAGTGPHFVLATLFAITALLGMFISNTATAVLMAPVALAVAQELGASPYPFAMIVALAASTAFMTPVSSPVNTLVVAPGHYTFSDFVRIGVPFSLIVLIVSVMLVPWLLPL
jgi:di/tricarboxylate transporter